MDEDVRQEIMNWKDHLPTSPRHWVCLASAAAVTAAATMALVMHFRGEQSASEAWFIAGAASIAPGLVAMSVRVGQMEDASASKMTAIMLAVFPILLAISMGLDALDPDALHRWAKAAVAAVIAASISPATAIIFRRTRG